MAFAANRFGRCSVCEGKVKIGEMITRWGGGYAHEPCSEAAKAKGQLEAGETYRSGGSASAWQRRPRRNQSRYS